MNILLKIYNRLILELNRFFFNDYFYMSKHFSQEGEDIVLKRYLDHVKKGFYIDVGAHHPKRFSNTYYFYKKGWNGINIDPMPGIMDKFNKFRKRDLNLEIGISTDSKHLDYYIFNERALNTFSKENAELWSLKEPYKIKNILKIQTKTLKDILNENLPPNTTIHFMSSDVEGFENEVLNSNDWIKFRPMFLLIENHDSLIFELDKLQIVEKMNTLGYILVSKLYYTLIFKDKNMKR